MTCKLVKLFVSPTAVCKMMELIEDEDFRPQEKEGIKHWPSFREKLSEGQRNRVEELLDRHRDHVEVQPSHTN